MPQLKPFSMVIVLAATLVVAGCSYRPLYGSGTDGQSVAVALAGVTVAEQKTRAGQLVRNELISSMGAQGGDSRFLLKLEPEEKSTAVSSTGLKLERHRYRLSVKYALLDAGTGKPATEGKSFSNVSYDTVEEPIADLRAAENARERAAREVAEDVRLRLAAFISSTTR